jgi:formylglycine-generating enzyme required for sulfatase activity
MPDRIKIVGDFFTTTDGFGYDKYATTILRLITGPDFPSPFTFGIFGEWGSGKTSLMRMIEERLRTEYFSRFVPVWFNPWRYEKEKHLIIPFLKTIQNAVSRHLESQEKLPEKTLKSLKKMHKQFSKIIFAVASGLEGELNLGIAKFKANLSKPIETAEKIEDREKDEEANKFEELNSLYYDAADYLEKVSGNKQNGDENILIAVFVDDLDRCLPEKAMEVLEGIKTFLDIPGYIFFIGVDRKVIEKGVQVKYRGYIIDGKTREKVSGETEDKPEPYNEIPITPSDYLEKIIQLPVALPPIEKSRVEGYLKGLLHENEPLMPYLDIIQTGLKQNPRTYKRFISTLAFYIRLAVEKSCLNLDNSSVQIADAPADETEKKSLMRLELLVKWTILNFAFTELVESIMKRKLLILELQEWIERLDKETVISEESYGTERKTGITDAPSHIRRWLSDDRLKAVLRKDIKRGDTGFSRDDIDLYIQMGEFTFLSPAKQEMTAAAFVKMSADVREAIGRMIKIPAGEFFYGEGKDKKKMPLSDYELGIYPITNAEYKEFIASKSDYKTPKDWKDGTYPEGKQDHPVVNVSFFDAQAYCEWRSKKEGMTYRLPSEEEWEKAARGTDGRQYPWGDEFDKDKCNTVSAGQ